MLRVQPRPPGVPLVAVYPQDGTAEADFPYLILNAPGPRRPSRPSRRRSSATPAGRTARRRSWPPVSATPTGSPGPALTSANGVTAKITALPRAILLPESVQHAAASWTAVTRPTNLLLVFDTSGSMGEEVPGTGQTRLDLTKAAAVGALALLRRLGPGRRVELLHSRRRQGLPESCCRCGAERESPAARCTGAAVTSGDLGPAARAATPGSTTRPGRPARRSAARYQAGAANIVAAAHRRRGRQQRRRRPHPRPAGHQPDPDRAVTPAKPVTLITVGLGTAPTRRSCGRSRPRPTPPRSPHRRPSTSARSCSPRSSPDAAPSCKESLCTGAC